MLYDQYFIDDLKDRADLVRGIAVALCLVAGLSLSVFGQEVPKAQKVDEFALVLTCEDVLARMDALAAEIQKSPNSSALIVISDDASNSRNAVRTRRLVESTLQLRGIEPERFQTLYVKGEPSARFWLTPPGSSIPIENAAEFAKIEFDISKPFIFGGADEMDICPTFVPKAFAKLLKDNPGSRGHIVVQAGDDPLVNRFAFAETWITELVEKQGVPRKRLRLFFSKGSGLTTAEFWFVPARTR